MRIDLLFGSDCPGVEFMGAWVGGAEGEESRPVLAPRIGGSCGGRLSSAKDPVVHKHSRGCSSRPEGSPARGMRERGYEHGLTSWISKRPELWRWNTARTAFQRAPQIISQHYWLVNTPRMATAHSGSEKSIRNGGKIRWDEKQCSGVEGEKRSRGGHVFWKPWRCFFFCLGGDHYLRAKVGLRYGNRLLSLQPSAASALVIVVVTLRQYQVPPPPGRVKERAKYPGPAPPERLVGPGPEASMIFAQMIVIRPPIRSCSTVVFTTGWLAAQAPFPWPVAHEVVDHNVLMVMY